MTYALLHFSQLSVFLIVVVYLVMQEWLLQETLIPSFFFFLFFLVHRDDYFYFPNKIVFSVGDDVERCQAMIFDSFNHSSCLIVTIILSCFMHGDSNIEVTKCVIIVLLLMLMLALHPK